MLGARAHSVGAGVVAWRSCVEALARSNCLLAGGTATEQRRFSFKYAQRSEHNEMRQPFFIHEKRFGIFSNEHNVGKPRRGLPFITPLFTKHVNLWETDTDTSTNRFFRSYVFGQRELHQLLGRSHAFEADGVAGRQADSIYETHNDLRYKGVPRPAITNAHYEPEWTYTLYRNTAHGSQLSNPRSPFTEEVLGPELLEIRDIKSVEHCKAWFNRLQYLIQLHYDAVGDIAEFKSRHTQHVHEFFVMFHDALSSFDFQDRYLVEQLNKVRPKELEDLFGIFLEMEANYVHEDYCPRCSLPLATTRFCGEGDTTTPFRKHRGRWALHQRWGKEWFDVVVRRAEALWYRATEDPYFGLREHTQRQTEALLNVYLKTRQRAKALDFLTVIQASKEFLLGQVRITAAMQAAVDNLLDHTPHQHLLTNAFRLDSRAALYTGSHNRVPHSPMQMRLDLEMNKYRRQQKEEGVVRVPPVLWRLDTSAIVPYKLNANKEIINWREVKQGIEASFLATGLPREAYTGQEWREMLYWSDYISRQAQQRAALEALRRTEEQEATERGGSFVVFPDRHWYRVFDTSQKALASFGVSQSGVVIAASTLVHEDTTAVPFKDAVSGANLCLNITQEACRWFGDYEHGDLLQVAQDANGKCSTYAVVVAGVNTAGPESEWALYAMHLDPVLRASKGLLELGKDCVDIRSRFRSICNTHQKRTVSVLEGGRGASPAGGQGMVREECLGQVVGVRSGELYVQWRLLKGGGSSLDRSVAVSLGTPEMVARAFRIQETGVGPLVEPPSWRTPFRNDFAEERLKELQGAPHQRERWASLIQGKYTPKKKRFGYAQHRTQDDFETKEYHDRLLARQFFNNPQAFEVIPERRERSVRFGGKWEYQRTHGLPTVDRTELEEGWGDAEAISDGEMDTIEQALRDISGRRPGNFVKAPSETQSLRLNESWWAPLEFGWEEHNREQRAFFDASEQKIVESAQLPFKGKIPPFGTTYGIGERIREVAEDYAKGFGLGPHGHSPSHDTASYNTLAAEEIRVQTLGLSHPLVRLFNQKLGDTDPHVWAQEQCGHDDANVRHVLLSLREWREKGRAPSLLLATLLGRYLSSEIDAYNAGIPEGVPRLQVPIAPCVSNASTDSNNIWVDVDRRLYGYEYMQQREVDTLDEFYVPALIQRAQVGGDAALLQQNLANFQLQLAKIVGKGIPPAVLATVASMQQQQHQQPRHGSNVVPYVRASELAKLLHAAGVSLESIDVVTRGLSNCPEHRRLDGVGADDFIVPVSLVLTWPGPSSAAKRKSSATAPHHAPSAARAGSDRDTDKMMVHVIQELQLRQDGLAMDIRYAIRENQRNAVLRQEFFNAFLPVYGMDHRKVGEMYSAYCEGKFVPNLREAVEAFVAFLANFCVRPESIPSVVPYFESDPDGRPPGQYTQVKLLPPETGAFIFDNVKLEVIETVNRFQRYGIVSGPTSVRPTSFIAPDSKDFNYFANRSDALARLTPGNKDDHNRLRDALTRSAHFKSIAAFPALQLILQSGAGLVVAFNRFFYRVAPMLLFYENVLQTYKAKVAVLRHTAQLANQGLARALENELSPAIEQEFRRNAERYWRNVLEGRHPMERTAAVATQTISGAARATLGHTPRAALAASAGNFVKQALGDTRGATPRASPRAGAGARGRPVPAHAATTKGRQSGSQNARTASVLDALKTDFSTTRGGGDGGTSKGNKRPAGRGGAK